MAFVLEHLQGRSRLARYTGSYEVRIFKGVSGAESPRNDRRFAILNRRIERAKNIFQSNHGNINEIMHAYVENTRNLPVIAGTQTGKIYEFYHTLTYNVQSLETLRKLSGWLFMVRGVLEKLQGIKAKLVSGDKDWQSWDFANLLQALQNWKEIHPIAESSKKPEGGQKPHRDRSFQSQEPNLQPKRCVYYDKGTHKSFECTQVTLPTERRRKLQIKGLCFNCIGNKHKAAERRSRTRCPHCKQCHHSSICDKTTEETKMPENGGSAMTTTQQCEKVCHPIVVVKVNGVMCGALLDRGATVSYASGHLLDRLKLATKGTVTRRMQTIVGEIAKRIEIYKLTISDTKENCVIPVQATRVDRRELLSVENPRYPELIRKYSHLGGVQMEDTDIENFLPVDIILETSEYAKIKTHKTRELEI